jgi:hypothetical protein
MHRFATRPMPLFALVGAILAGCSPSEDECDAASWINDPPEAMRQAATPLPESRYRLLLGSAKEMALEKLRGQAFYEPSPEEAQALADGQNTGGHPYILRAASYRTDDTRVMVASGAVHIESESLAQSDLPLRCEAVLAYLDAEPSELYVTAGLTE